MTLVPHVWAFSLLAFWGALGWSAAKLLRLQMDDQRLLLISPTIGISVTLLAVLWPNVLGLPIKSFAVVLTVLLTAVAVIETVRFRPAVTRPVALCLGIAALSMLVVGAPALVYGLDWISNTNDDWANYNLAAIRFLNEGYFTTPSAEALRNGQNYPGYFWFMHVAGGARSGAELLLAWTAALPGVSPFYAFVPVILAFHGAMLLAAFALAVGERKPSRLLMLAFAITAFMPLLVYSVALQLIAQVMGLAMLATLSTLAIGPLLWRQSALGLLLVALVCAAFAISYPEVLPFFGISFLIYQALDRSEWARIGLARAKTLLAVIAMSAALILPNVPGLLGFLMRQLAQGERQSIVGDVSIFPYFIIPSGFPTLWGLTELGSSPGEPWLSMAIALGIIISILTVASTWTGVRYRFLPALILAVMIVLCPLLAFSRNDFGLFKLALLCQPFLVLVLIGSSGTLSTRYRIGLGIALLALCLPTAARYVLSSTGSDRFASSTHVPNASALKLLSLTQQSTPERSACNTTWDISLPPLIKMLAANSGCTENFPTRDVFTTLVAADGVAVANRNKLIHPTGLPSRARNLLAEITPARRGYEFHDLNGVAVLAVVFQRVASATSLRTLDALPSIFNGEARLQPDTATPHLMHLNSTLGSHYYLPDGDSVSIYGLEQDPFQPARKMSALGRYLMFAATGAGKAVRLVADVSASFRSDPEKKLPPAQVMGATSVALGFAGRGAARVVTEPFEPLQVDGESYLLLDLGEEGVINRTRKSGLMNLFGRSIPLDYRKITIWGRNIRLIADSDYDPADKPQVLQKFPQDLQDPRLEFSGLFEDGWMSELGFVALAAPTGGGELVIDGQMPGWLGVPEMQLTITLNDTPPLRHIIRPGDFTIRFPVDAGRQLIRFAFDKSGEIGARDPRRVSAFLRAMKVEAPSSGAATVRHLAWPQALQDPRVRQVGLHADAWMTTSGAIEFIAGPEAHELLLDGMMPGWLELDALELTLTVNGSPAGTHTLHPGDFSIRVPTTGGKQTIEFKFNADGKIPGADGRRVTALLRSLAVR